MGLTVFLLIFFMVLSLVRSVYNVYFIRKGYRHVELNPNDLLIIIAGNGVLFLLCLSALIQLHQGY